MGETPREMADRIECEARQNSDPDQRDYGLMVAGVIRKDRRTTSEKERQISPMSGTSGAEGADPSP